VFFPFQNLQVMVEKEKMKQRKKAKKSSDHVSGVT
jgi:hypothetical protein